MDIGTVVGLSTGFLFVLWVGMILIEGYCHV